MTPKGVVHVANLYLGTISRSYRGKVTTVAALKDALSLTFTRGALPAGTAAPAVLEGAPSSGPGGSIVRITFWTVGADPLPLSEISLGDQR